MNENWGRIYENVVYNQLFSQQREVFYYKTKNLHEVDFFVDRKELIQVSYDLSKPETLERERLSLLEAMAETGIKESIIIYDSVSSGFSSSQAFNCFGLSSR